MFLNAKDFTYTLPEEKIADRPLATRDASKLLVYDSGAIEHRRFSDLPTYLTENSLLVVNETKVLHARLFMFKETGGKVEVMCLEPIAPSSDPAVALASTEKSVWKCMLGGKRIRVGQILRFDPSVEYPEFTATIVAQDENVFEIEFNWNDQSTLGSILEQYGNIPIPPYMRRAADSEDSERYQTVYANHLGSVAAPTAGLHFTDETLLALESKGIEQVRVSLHVGAGTFVPITATNIGDHTMHVEQIRVSLNTLERLVDALQSDTTVTAVGTTSVRTLESLYWLGVKQCIGLPITSLQQWEPYENLLSPSASISPIEAFAALVERGQDVVSETQLMIVPGYSFRVVDNLVTNFHQPGSTLLCLVAAFVGEGWKNMYDTALSNNYRFLSYGDSSLLIGCRR